MATTVCHFVAPGSHACALVFLLEEGNIQLAYTHLVFFPSQKCLNITTFVLLAVLLLAAHYISISQSKSEKLFPPTQKYLNVTVLGHFDD